jgi:aspartyl-tRNA synthetase
MRTHYNNELRIENVNEEVKLFGWVQKVRDLGGLLFIDLRDYTGLTQIVIRPENENYETALKIRNEYVIEVNGSVIERESKNKNIPTGEIEVVVNSLKILSEALTPPMIVADETDALEDTRLKYRYLDLRRPVLQSKIIKRHQTNQSIRNYLNSNRFFEIETPILGKSTPEGARDYLVPSRIHNGSYYALPQSPQIFKQLLMVSGFDRYYQIAKTFRDEDLRADRQPEFTQIDIETSFLTEAEFQSIVEGMLQNIFKDVINYDVQLPLPRMTYADAMNRYGTDKPDTRFDLELQNVSDLVANSEFSVFANAEEVKCLCVKGQAANYSRKAIDKLTDFVKRYQAKGLAWLKHTEEGLTGPIAKFFSDEEKQAIIERISSSESDLILFVADKKSVVAASLGALRNKLGKELELIDTTRNDLLWIVDWPMFEYSEEDDRYYSAHHPFTRPQEGYYDNLKNDKDNCIAAAYDVVCNGYELGSGSLRIYDQQMQSDMFEALGFSEEEAYKQFGFFIDALKYGTPPHCGIALGVDRIVMILTDTENIRDVIAFPKNASARCVMSDSPSPVSQAQLDELGIAHKE